MSQRENPLVSIVVITYNHEAYIAQAIESILDQKCTYSYEIVIGEDCSTDNTAHIVKSYGASHSDRIVLNVNKKNVGGLQNERDCIRKARGKYICFLEGDDYWMDNLKLQKQVDFMENNPEYGLVHADVDHFYESTGKTEYRVNKANGIKSPEGHIFDELMKPDQFFIKPATVCFRKELVEMHFDYDKAIEENWPLTDFPLWLDIAAHSKVHYMDEVFATYRLLNESASRTRSPEKKLKFHKGLHRIKMHYCSKYKLDKQIVDALEETYNRDFLKIAFNLRDGALARSAIDYLRAGKKSISFKERLLYAGAKYTIVKSFLNLVRNKK
jgi:glycosyltransferase involved in cell wall biosynthesis